MIFVAIVWYKVFDLVGLNKHLFYSSQMYKNKLTNRLYNFHFSNLCLNCGVKKEG